jgi:hypothetical protein
MPALHELGDPVGAAAHIRDTLSEDGTCLLVEPFAEDRLEDNLTPIGRISYAASTKCCARPVLAPNRAAWHSARRPANPGYASAHDRRFPPIRRAAEAPFNLVLEARP